MKFTICWYEYHDPSNWGETEEEGIKNILKSLPSKNWNYDGDDGWIEVQCIDTFEADSIKEAKKYVIENYDIPSGVFTVWVGNDTVNPAFTEEDVYEEAPLRKLTRDKVVSIARGRELVGVYFADTDGSEVLLECSPKKADKIIKLWNKE